MRLNAPAVLGLALLLLTPVGCIDGGDDRGPPDDGNDDTPDRYTYEECDSIDFSYEVNDTSWHAARVGCEANVTGTDRQAIPCGSPEDAELAASTNLTGGRIHLVVTDDANETMADHRLSDTEGQPRNLSLSTSGDPGDWTLTVERLEGFEGRFSAELACPE